MYFVNWLGLFQANSMARSLILYQSSDRFEGDKKEEARKRNNQQELKNKFHQTAEFDPLIPPTLHSQLDLQISNNFPQPLFLLKGN